MTDAHRSIEWLIYRYAERMDAGDLAGVAALFARAEVRSGTGDVARGSDQVLARLRAAVRLHPDGTPRTHHVTTNVVIEVDCSGTSARASSYVTVLQQVEGAQVLQPVFAGRYADRFELVDGTWRFALRERRSSLVGDLSNHLLNQPPPAMPRGGPGNGEPTGPASP